MVTFPYTLVRSKRKSVSISVRSDATIVVRAPLRVSVSSIDSFIESHTEWIRRNVERMRSRLSLSENRYDDGELFWYLGERYPLRISEAGNLSVSFSDNAFVLLRRFRSRAKERFCAWYKREAKKILAERVAYFAERHGLSYHSIRINAARTRWGSCSGKGHLNFTFRLVMAPLFVIDSVVVHELAHLVHPNHSKYFWHTVAEMLPDFETGRQWLKRNGHLLEC